LVQNPLSAFFDIYTTGGAEVSKRQNTKPGGLCSCGSGKKYKDCCAPKDQARIRMKRRARKALTWTGGIALLVAVLYGLSQTSGFAYDENDLAVIDFSPLNEDQKNSVLEAANRGRCSCGCGLGLAQCVVTDQTCPIRTDNIDKIRTMVADARSASGG
jgi:hypothetical protein